ncbi:MAG: MFS transporter [Candidatus Limivivens sp.]|nr:MFS transporter [Candidatus Limivivens sp.]
MNNLILMSEYVLGRMRRIFFMSYPETRIDYKESRIRYTIGDSMAQTIAQLSGGTFLVMLMEEMGISDGNMGIIASFGCIAAMMQLVSVKLTGKIQKNKLLVCLTVLQRLWLSFIFFLPLLPIEKKSARFLMVGCYCFVQLCVQLGTPATIDWIASLAPSRIRGHYFAIKDSVAVMVIIVSTLIMGIVVDVAKAVNPHAAFAALGTVIGIMTVINVAAFAGMKEPKLSCTDENGKEYVGSLARKKHHLEEEAEKERDKENGRSRRGGNAGILGGLKEAFQERPFRRILLLNGVWVTGYYVAIPFNSSYQVKELQLPYTYLMVLSFVTNLLRIYLAPKAGKLADKIGIARVTKWTLGAVLGYLLVMVCSVPSNAYVTSALSAAFLALGWTFVGTGMLGLQLESFPEEKRIVQFALFSVLSGTYGFLVSVVAGNLINALQKMNLEILGIRLYAQQITNLAGCVFIVITIFYLSGWVREAEEKGRSAVKK